MRLSKIIIIILIAVMAQPLLSVFGQSTGLIDTSVGASDIASTGVVGDTLALQTDIYDALMNRVSSGQLDTLDMTPVSLGQGTNSTYKSNSSSVQFFSPNSMDIDGIRIPVANISDYMSSMSWELSSGGVTVVSGVIFASELMDMVSQDSAIYLLFNSHQTDFFGSVRLTANTTYSIVFDRPQSIIVEYVRAQRSSSTVDGVEINLDVLITRSHQKSSVDTTTDQTSINLNVSGTHKIIRYYSDPVDQFFLPSIDIQEITVSDQSNLELSTQSVTGYSLDLQNISASVGFLGSPVYLQSIRFEVKISGVWVYLGSELTNASGIAELAYELNIQPGTYPIRTSTYFNDELVSDIALLTVLQPIGNLVAVSAIGSFGSGPTDVTTYVTISGYLMDQNSKAVGNYLLNISSERDSLLALTNSSGYFMAQFQENVTIGLYSGYYTIRGMDDTYLITPLAVDLVITEGEIEIVTPQFTSFTSQERILTISGQVKNPTGRQINADVLLEYVGTSTEIVGRINSSSTFSFSFNNSYFFPQYDGYSLPIGRHTFRLTVTKQDFTTEIFDVYLDVIPDNVTITRDGIVRNGKSVPTGDLAPSSEWIVLNVTTVTNLEFLLLNSKGEGIGNSLLKFEVYVADTWEVLNYSKTNGDGIADLWWTVQMRHVEDSLGILKVSSINENFTATYRYFYYVSEKIGFTPDVVITNASYGLTTTFDGVVTGKEGQSLPDMPLRLTLDGIALYVQTDSLGYFFLSHRFDRAGLYSLDIELYTHYYYYNLTTYSIPVEISKAEYSILSDTVTLTSGDYVTITAEVRDKFGFAGPGVPVVLTFNSTVLFNGTTDEVGKVTYTSDSVFLQDIGDYQFSWIIYEDPNYLTSSKVVTVTVRDIGTSISISISDYLYNSPSTAYIRVVPVIDSPLHSIEGLEVRITIENYTTFMQTDANGLISYRLPYDLLPGNYSIVAEFSGNSVFANSSSSTLFRVLGSTIDLTWIETPSDVVFGDSLTFSFRLTANGVIMAHLNVTVEYGSLTWSSITDSQGIFTFNKTILEELVDQPLTVSVEVPKGYDPLSVSTTISVRKIGMNVVSDSPYSVNYTDSVDINVTVTDELNRLVPDAMVTVYLRITGQDTWIYLTEGSTNEYGLLQLTLDISTIEIQAGQALTLRFNVVHPLYKDTELVAVKVSVEPEALEVTYSSVNATYYQYNQFGFRVTDDEGEVVPGLKVVLVSSTRDKLGEGIVGADGWVYLNFMVYDGQEIFTLSIYDNSGNFISLQRVMPFTFLKAESEIVSSYVNLEGNPGIELRLRTMSLQDIDSLLTIYYSDDGINWILMGSSLSNSSILTFDTGQTTLIRYYRVVMEGSDSFKGTTVDLEARMYQIDLEVFDTYVEYGDYFTPNIEVYDAPALPFYFTMIVDGEVVPVLFNAGEFEQVFLNLPVGNYSVVYQIDAQGWIQDSTFNARLVVQREEIVVEDGEIFTVLGQEEVVNLRIYDNDGQPLAAYVVITALIGNDEYQLANGYSNANGEFAEAIFIPEDWEIGSVDVRIAASIGEYYVPYKQVRLMYIRNPVELTILNFDELEFIWSVGITIKVQAFNPYTGTYVSGLQISVLLIIETGGVLEDQFALGLTDVNGLVIFENLFPDVNPLNFDDDLIIVVEVVENYEYQNSEIQLRHIIDFQMVQLVIDGIYEIEDNGMQENQQILISFESDFGPLALDPLLLENEGTNFNFELYLQGTGQNNPFDQGQLQRVDGEDQFLFIINQMGRWDIVVTVDSPFVVLRAEFLIQAGWDKTSVIFNWEDGQTVDIIYGTEELEVTLTTDEGFLLEGIAVIAETPFGDDLYFTDVEGMFLLNLDPEMYVPSDLLYRLTLRTDDIEYLAEQTEITVYLKVNFLTSPLAGTIEDTYIDEQPRLEIESELQNGNYSYALYRDDLLLYNASNLSEGNLERIISGLDYSIGNYTLMFWRVDPFFNSSLQILEFEVMPIPVIINLDISTNQTVTISVFDARNNARIDYRGNYSITVLQNGVAYTFVKNSSVFQLGFQGNYTLIVEVGGEFNGSTQYSTISPPVVGEQPNLDGVPIGEITAVLTIMGVGFVFANFANIRRYLAEKVPNLTK